MFSSALGDSSSFSFKNFAASVLIPSPLFMAAPSALYAMIPSVIRPYYLTFARGMEVVLSAVAPPDAAAGSAWRLEAKPCEERKDCISSSRASTTISIRTPSIHRRQSSYPGLGHLP